MDGTDILMGSSGNLRDPPSTRVLSTQLLIACTLGFTAVAVFGILRTRFPHIFIARLHYLKKINDSKKSSSDSGNVSATRSSVFTRSFLNISEKSLFNTFRTLHRITDEEIIDFAGLDAYVFLDFFKMAIQIVSVCWISAFIIISPIRYHFTGKFDEGDENLFTYSDIYRNGVTRKNNSDGEDTLKPHYYIYLLTYVIFTYFFTLVTCHFLVKHSVKIIKIRQTILGKQNSITDRTIRLSGIPPELRTEKALRETIENLNIGKVEKIVICKEWKKLDNLFKIRSKIVKKLEFYWANYMEIGNSVNVPDPYSDIIGLSGQDSRTDTTENNLDNRDNNNNNNYYSNNDNNNQCTVQSVPPSVYFDDLEGGSPMNSQVTLESRNSLISTISVRARPTIRQGFWGLFGKKKDALDYYTNQLDVINEEIRKARNEHYPATPTAFLTMDSVATAQTLAQAVLDPRIGYLIASPAPAPADIMWENATLPSHSRKLKIYYITIITGILGVAFIFPVGYLATLLNYKSIKKFWPTLANFLLHHEWALKFVTELLPVYLYTLLNAIIPFLYVWLSSKQGFISHGEEELSVVSKNFFYVFVNLFLVFTMAGTASNYWGYLSDSKQIALQLAQSLHDLASFYVDTIVLQGIGLMPFKLLPMGRIFQFLFFWVSHSTRGKAEFMFGLGVPTAREITTLYQPPTFNFGLQLPHPLLVLVITLIYSVISTKILSAGLVYFIIGYYVFKFLLIYTYIHPQHSTGKVMPIIFRRVILGLLLFQLTVAGSLVLEKSWILAACLTPLPLFTLMVLWYFQEKLKPLSVFIALRAIKINESKPSYSDDIPLTTSSNPNLSGTILSSNQRRKKTHNNRTSTDFEPTGLSDTGDLDTSKIWSDAIFDDSTDSQQNAAFHSCDPNTDSSSRIINNLKTGATIDERRELFQDYDYPYLVDHLEGPWIGIKKSDTNTNDSYSDNWILVWTSDGIIRKKIKEETSRTIV